MKVSQDVFNICVYDIHRLQKLLDIEASIPKWTDKEIDIQNKYANLLSLFLYRLAVDPNFFSYILPKIIDDKSLVPQVLERLNALQYYWTYQSTIGCFAKLDEKSSGKNLDSDKDLEDYFERKSRQYLSNPANFIYPGRQMTNPSILWSYFEDLLKDKSNENWRSLMLLFQKSHSFELYGIVSHYADINSQFKTKEWKFINSWDLYYNDHIVSHLRNYQYLNPTITSHLYHRSNESSLNQEITDRKIGEITREFSKIQTSERWKYDDWNVLFSAKNIYISPLAEDLRRIFAEHAGMDKCEILTPREFSILSNESQASYLNYIQYTSGALTILCEFYFNKLFNESNAEVLKLLNGTFDKENHMGILDFGKTKVSFCLFAASQLLLAGMYQESERICLCCIEREDKTIDDLFFAHLLLAELYAFPSELRNLDLASKYFKKVHTIIKDSKNQIVNITDFKFWKAYVSLLESICNFVSTHDSSTISRNLQNYYTSISQLQSKYYFPEVLYETSIILTKILRNGGIWCLNYENIILCYLASVEESKLKVNKDNNEILIQHGDWKGHCESRNHEFDIPVHPDIQDYLSELNCLSNSLIQTKDGKEEYCIYLNEIRKIHEAYAEYLNFINLFQLHKAIQIGKDIFSSNNLDDGECHDFILKQIWNYLDIFDYGSAEKLVDELPEVHSNSGYEKELYHGIIHLLNNKSEEGYRSVKSAVNTLIENTSSSIEESENECKSLLKKLLIYCNREESSLKIIDVVFSGLQKAFGTDIVLVWISEVCCHYSNLRLAVQWFKLHENEQISDSALKIKFDIARAYFYGAQHDCLKSSKIYADLLKRDDLSLAQRNEILKYLANSYDNLGDYANSMKYREELLDDSNESAINLAILKISQEELFVNSVEVNRTKDLFKDGDEASQKLLSSELDTLDCADALSKLAEGLENFVYFLIKLTILPEFKKKFPSVYSNNPSITTEEKDKVFIGWSLPLFENKSLFLVSCEHLSDDLKKAKKRSNLTKYQSFIYKYLESIWGEKICERISHASGLLRSYRNAADHPKDKQILLNYDDFAKKYREIVVSLNLLFRSVKDIHCDISLSIKQENTKYLMGRKGMS